MKSLASRVLLALLGGVGLGVLLRALGQGAVGVAEWLEAVGTIWVNAIRMTVIPLVVSMLITAVAAVGDPRRIGRLGARAVALFLIMLSATAVLVAVGARPMFTWLRLDPADTARLRASAQAVPPALSAAANAREFLLSLVPPNIIQAAAESAMLPVLIFSVLTAFAITRAPSDARDALLIFFRGIRDATFVLIGWILAVAPIGVFGLGIGLGNRLGASAVSAFGYYLGLVIALHVLSGIVLYWLASYAGRIPIVTFARAVAPAQAVAFSSRSSYATLPALIECAERRLHLPERISGFVIPLAVAVFRLTSPIYWTIGAVFVGRLYGVDLGPAGIATIAASAVLLNAATPGIPSGGLLIQAPVYIAVGLPVEGIGLLIAVDAIPDMFKTAFNVTADMAVAVILSRGELQLG